MHFLDDKVLGSPPLLSARRGVSTQGADSVALGCNWADANVNMEWRLCGKCWGRVADWRREQGEEGSAVRKWDGAASSDSSSTKTSKGNSKSGEQGVQGRCGELLVSRCCGGVLIWGTPDVAGCQSFGPAVKSGRNHSSLWSSLEMVM